MKWDTNKIASNQKTIKTLRSVIKIVTTKKVHRQWIDSWKESKHERELFALKFKSRKIILKLHENLIKKLNSLTIQSRTKKIELRRFLHKRKMSRFINSQCQCKRKEQTIEHVLLTCKRFKKKRSRLWDKEKSKSQLDQLRLKKILIDLINLKKVVQFMKEIELIDQSRALNIDEY